MMMNKEKRLGGEVQLVLLALLAACARPEPREFAITHVTVVDVGHDALLHDRTIVIDGARITRVDTSARVALSRRTPRLDGTGRFVIPGLWDMHVHLSDSATAAQLLSWGITGARVMSGPLDKTLALREWLRSNPTLGPRLFVAGLALHGKESFASDTGLALVQSAADARRAVDSLARRRVDFIKVHEGLSRDAWFTISQSAAEHYLRLAGHVPAGLNAEALSADGLTSIEHLEFLPDACLVIFDSTTRARHSVPAGCRQADLHLLLEQLHRNGVWLDPTISSFRVFAPRQFPSILAGFADLAAQIRAAGLPIMAGTDIGSAGIVAGESLHDELGLLVAAGYTPGEALRAATLNPATYLQAGDTLGQVAHGYVADLVVLAANPLDDIGNTRRVVAVVRAGRLIQTAATGGAR
jgi:imidazolonepropionase-like amidohydrolase